ncbi:hypothetical protein O9G_004921 [Rozella allomycis CSF55]|uniref:SANTA domain-containing protein n=1 Tax=Rozella allomycis (strain CSF55) TaxID=988480 RepID=A0A075AZ66_ROZAC|nr:hypothetical protein O9G_004921 [Rozella allomycis CSF55]|eukprot:EPZ35557.1 hypothetical protein O9G_004921 [Rozella allomycis CSF55]
MPVLPFEAPKFHPQESSKHEPLIRSVPPKVSNVLNTPTTQIKRRSVIPKVPKSDLQMLLELSTEHSPLRNQTKIMTPNREAKRSASSQENKSQVIEESPVLIKKPSPMYPKAIHKTPTRQNYKENYNCNSLHSSDFKTSNYSLSQETLNFGMRRPSPILTSPGTSVEKATKKKKLKGLFDSDSEEEEIGFLKDFKKSVQSIDKSQTETRQSISDSDFSASEESEISVDDKDEKEEINVSKERKELSISEKEELNVSETLSDWYFLVTNNEPRLTGVSLEESKYWFLIEGTKTGDDGNFLIWHSSYIVDRINSMHLKTCTGKIYKLLGKINKEEMEKSEFSEMFIKKFTNGFPLDWKDVIKDYFNSLNEHSNKDENYDDCEIFDEVTIPIDKIERPDINKNKKAAKKSTLSKKAIQKKSEEKSIQKKLEEKSMQKKLPTRPKRTAKKIEAVAKKPVEPLNRRAKTKKAMENHKEEKQPIRNTNNTPIKNRPGIEDCYISQSGRRVAPPLPYWQNVQKRVINGDYSKVVQLPLKFNKISKYIE